MKKNIVKVVGAIIVENNRIFCARRPLDKKFGGLWEFPGGKIEVGESFETALKREILEELDIEVEVLDIFMNTVKEYDSFIIDLTCLNCNIIDFNSFRLKEHIEYRWVDRKELLNLEWVPTDIPIVEKLQGQY